MPTAEVNSKLLQNLIVYYTGHVRNLTEFKLVKLIYLTEVLYYLRHGKRATNIPFISYHYGPYADVITEKALEIDQKYINVKDIVTARGFDATVYDPRSGVKCELPKNVSDIAEGIASEFGRMNIDELKNFVYATEPYKNSKKKQLIDFTKLHVPQDGDLLTAKNKVVKKLRKKKYVPTEMTQEDRVSALKDFLVSLN